MHYYATLNKQTQKKDMTMRTHCDSVHLTSVVIISKLWGNNQIKIKKNMYGKFLKY